MKTMSGMNSRRGVTVLAALAVVGAAAGAFAQGDKPGKKSDEFSRPLGGGKAPAGGSAQMFLSETNGDDRYEIAIRGNEVTAKVNGKEVPEDRIRREDDRIAILDEDGKVVKEFNVGGMGGGTWTLKPPSGPRLQVAPRGDALRWYGGGDQAQPQKVPAPKVMIGITMHELDEEQAKEAGIDAGQGIMIASVIKGLPADEAGLEHSDIITSIDGSDGPLDQQKFRETINRKEPGDKVKLTVLRGGEKKKFEVALKKWDPEKLGMAGAPMKIEGLPGDGMTFQWHGEGVDKEQMERWMEAHREQLRQGAEPGEGRGRREPGGAEGEGAPQGRPHGFVLRGAPGEWDVFMQPFEGFQGRTDDMNRRLDELQERLDRLNEKLDRLAETLEKVAGKK